MVLAAQVKVPPLMLLLRFMDEPIHTAAGPVTMPASMVILTGLVATSVPQLLVTLYFIVSAPAAKPIITPVVETVDSVPLLIDHAPPAILELAMAVRPAATVPGLVIMPA
jgi:hypothetical protein